MATKVSRSNTVYGYPNPQLASFPDPIVAQRAPTAADKAVVGQIWVDQVGQLSYIFIKNSAGNAVWVVQSNNGGAAVFTSLAVNGASTFTGSILQSAGNVSIGADAAAQTILIGTGTAAKTVAIGSATAGSTLILDAAAGVDCQTNLVLSTSGTKLQIAGGSAGDYLGRATLPGGAGNSITVNIASITANDRIFLSVSTAGGTQGFLSYAIGAGSFTISSTDIADTSEIAYFIVREV
jgi:hypothetical protein